MKVQILFSFFFFFFSSLYAEVSTIAPFSVLVEPDNKSFKDSGTVNGIYLSTGTLVYLNEFSYSHADLRYKQGTTNLEQDDFYFSYSRYFLGYSYKLALHTITTSDTNLQNGSTFIVGYKRWKYFNISKLTYGIDFYHSFYTNGSDLNEVKKAISLNQLTGYISYFKPFQIFSNFLSLKLNYEDATTYDQSYFSFALKDIIYFKKVALEFGYFGGKMQTGIMDGGATVYNSKDLLQQKVQAKITYTVIPSVKINTAYSSTLLDEYLNQKSLNNQTISFGIVYTR